MVKAVGESPSPFSSLGPKISFFVVFERIMVAVGFPLTWCNWCVVAVLMKEESVFVVVVCTVR